MQASDVKRLKELEQRTADSNGCYYENFKAIIVCDPEKDSHPCVFSKAPYSPSISCVFTLVQDEGKTGHRKPYSSVSLGN
jgi:hypothetical protein